MPSIQRLGVQMCANVYMHTYMCTENNAFKELNLILSTNIEDP